MKHFIDTFFTLIASWQPIAILFSICNAFFNPNHLCYYKKLPVYPSLIFFEVKYYFIFYYLFLMDITIGHFQINYVEPFKLVVKVVGEGITLAFALFEIIDQLPKEQQKGLMIASLILVAMHMERRMEQLERENEEQLVKEVL